MKKNGQPDLTSLPAWLQHAAEIEEHCESVAAAGLAAELGMIDREQLRRSRAATEAAGVQSDTASAEH